MLRVVLLWCVCVKVASLLTLARTGFHRVSCVVVVVPLPRSHRLWTHQT